MPFCKFCKDAGKTQSEFTSHYPKDTPGKDGTVVCPTILSNECRYCHTIGHAKSHCPILKEKNSRKRMTAAPKRSFHRSPQPTANDLNGWAMVAMKDAKCGPSLRVQAVNNAPSKNSFAVLCEDDDKPKKQVALPKVVEAKAAAGCWCVTPDLSNEAIQQRLATVKQANTEFGIRMRGELRNERAKLKERRATYEDHIEQKFKSFHCQHPCRPWQWVKDMNESPVGRHMLKSCLPNRTSVKDMIAALPPSAPTEEWGDCDSQNWSDIGEEEIVLDSFGRPSTDNSAW